MKTEFNVERVCERLAAVVVDVPEEIGQPSFEIKDGCLYISFPGLDAHFGPSKAEILELTKPAKKRK